MSTIKTKKNSAKLHYFLNAYWLKSFNCVFVDTHNQNS